MPEDPIAPNINQGAWYPEEEQRVPISEAERTRGAELLACLINNDRPVPSFVLRKLPPHLIAQLPKHLVPLGVLPSRTEREVELHEKRQTKEAGRTASAMKPAAENKPSNRLVDQLPGEILRLLPRAQVLRIQLTIAPNFFSKLIQVVNQIWNFMF